MESVWNPYGCSCLAGRAGGGAGHLPFSPERDGELPRVASRRLRAWRDWRRARHASGKSADACIDDAGRILHRGHELLPRRRSAQYWDGAARTGPMALSWSSRTAADAELKELGSAAPSPAAALREMQRAWTAYRDAACAYEASTWGGGHRGGPAANQCMMLLTGRQALALEDRLRGDRAVTAGRRRSTAVARAAARGAGVAGEALGWASADRHRGDRHHADRGGAVHVGFSRPRCGAMRWRGCRGSTGTGWSSGGTSCPRSSC